MKLFKKSKSHFYWYDSLTVRGQRYRGSTKESNSHQGNRKLLV